MAATAAALAILACVGCGRLGFDETRADAAVIDLVGCWAFDEGAGTTTADCSGNGNTGTLSGAASWDIGRHSGAMSFGGGPSDTVVVISTSSLSFDITSFSYGLWVKLVPGAPNDGYQIPLWKGGSSTSYPGYDLEYNVPAAVWGLSLSDGVSTVSVRSPVRDYRDGIWHHVFAVVDRAAGMASLYIDGAVVSEPVSISSLGSLNGMRNLVFGGQLDSNRLTGAVDDARIYNRAIAASEIADLVN